METVNGKKLLVLGAGANEISLVARARELGIYVIVTDNCLNHKISSSKDLANEYWDISWSDIDALYKKSIETGINGVIAGYSEIRVENCIKLCKKLNLPCYINEEQLEITRDKIKFKEQCVKSGVPVIKEYDGPENVTSADFPVIVKPTDRAGSIGISIANNRKELVKAYEYAMNCSLKKRVIIEKFIQNAKKFDVYYSIVDGKIDLLSTDDVINAKNNGTDKVIQSGWVLPSVKMDLFQKSKENQALQQMLRDMKIQNGYIFFSGFAMEDDTFVFFESGFRLCGGYLFNYFPLIGKVNNLDLFLYHSLTGSAKKAADEIKPGKPLKNVTINFYLKKGIVSKIDGFEELSKLPTCTFTSMSTYLGCKCTEDNAILVKAGMAYFCAENVSDIVKDVKKAYDLVSILDENGNDLIYDRIDLDVIENWWK